MVGAIGLAAVALVVKVSPVSGFTQSGAALPGGNVVPMGHEWITRMAALELLGGDPLPHNDPKDPRKTWKQGLAKNPSLKGADHEVNDIKHDKLDDGRYESTYDAVFAAIIGERWVDIGGFNVTKSSLGSVNCFDMVAQEPVDVQYDHFMRKWSESGNAGGVSAADQSRARFLQYFVNAATSPSGVVTVWDGGVTAAKVTVDRNYFLLGRAVHLFEDSFSLEHTVRQADDNYETIHQVKSYLCAAGSEQHSHSTAAVLDYTSGDVIWIPGTRWEPGWGGYKASNMKTNALVATEAMKDVWAAFIRVMAKDDKDRAAAAQQEAQTLIENWLKPQPDMSSWYSDPRHRGPTYVLAPGESGPGVSVATCMKGLSSTQSQTQYAANIEATRRTCLYNIQPVLGFSDAVDPSLKMPYNWEWTSTSWQTPPASWQIPNVVVPPEIKVTIKSVKAKQYMVAPDGVSDNNWIYVKGGDTLKWIVVGDRDHAIFRSSKAPLFLSYRESTGAVKFYDTATDADYKLDKTGSARTIYNNHWKDYMWLSGSSPYITHDGDPKKDSAQWIIDGLPGSW